MRRIERVVENTADCDFYHVSELPDGTLTPGQWDLRETVDAYLGHVDFRGKRVVEIGPASGFLSFHMERQGARVTAVEPPLEAAWDFVPRVPPQPEFRAQFTTHMNRLRNSFCYLHRAYGSQVEYFEADAHRLPETLSFDIGLLASVLLHVSQPLKLMESVARVVSETMIVVDVYDPAIADRAVCELVPTSDNGTMTDWWHISPKLVEQFLGVLGFSQVTTTRSLARSGGVGGFNDLDLFAIVGRR